MAKPVKKQWVSLGRDFAVNPKVRQDLGECIWLYLYMVDKANWETGTIIGWKDADEAAALELNPRTVKDQRQKLDRLGYIDFIQRQRDHDVIIRDWHVPGHWDTIVNPSVHGPKDEVPTDTLSVPQSPVPTNTLNVHQTVPTNTPARSPSVPFHTVQKSDNNIVVPSQEHGQQTERAVGEHVMYLGTEEPAACPQCHTGMVVVKARRSDNKKFLGCSRYVEGCRWTGDIDQKIMRPPKTVVFEDGSASI